jgi:hypothetical protein
MASSVSKEDLFCLLLLLLISNELTEATSAARVVGRLMSQSNISNHMQEKLKIKK